MLIEWLLVGLGVLLTLGTAVFVASEFSLVTLDPGVVERQTPPDDRRSQSVLKALRRLSTELSGAQVGITLTTILLGYTTQPAVVPAAAAAARGRPRSARWSAASSRASSRSSWSTASRWSSAS